MTRSKIGILLAVFTVFFMKTGSAGAVCVEPAMGDYTAYAAFQASAVEPNILIILDNSGSMDQAAYGDRTGAAYDHNTRYYG